MIFVYNFEENTTDIYLIYAALFINARIGRRKLTLLKTKYSLGKYWKTSLMSFVYTAIDLLILKALWIVFNCSTVYIYWEIN